MHYIKSVSRLKRKFIAVSVCCIMFLSGTVFADVNVHMLSPELVFDDVVKSTEIQAVVISELIEKRAEEWKDKTIEQIYCDDILLWNESTEPLFEGFSARLSIKKTLITISIPASNISIIYYDHDLVIDHKLLSDIEPGKTSTRIINERISRKIIFNTKTLLDYTDKKHLKEHIKFIKGLKDAYLSDVDMVQFSIDTVPDKYIGGISELFDMNKLIVCRNNVPGMPRGQTTIDACEISELKGDDCLDAAKALERWETDTGRGSLHTNFIRFLAKFLGTPGIQQSDPMERIYLAVTYDEKKRISRVEGVIRVCDELDGTWIGLWEIRSDNRLSSDTSVYRGVGRQILFYSIFRELKNLRGGLGVRSLGVFSELSSEGIMPRFVYDRQTLQALIEGRNRKTLRMLLDESKKIGDAAKGARKILKRIDEINSIKDLAAEDPQKIKTSPRKPSYSEKVYRKFVEAKGNADIISTLLSKSGRDILLRIPVELIRNAGKENANSIASFLNAFQKAPNGFVELYYMSGIEKIDNKEMDSIRAQYNIEQKPLNDGFESTMENTISLLAFINDKGSDSEYGWVESLKDLNLSVKTELGDIDHNRTQIVPVGFQNDLAGIIRSSIMGLKLIHIARYKSENERIDESFVERFVYPAMKDYAKLLIALGIIDFDFTARDMVDLASGGINDRLRALKKLIDLLPITPIDTEELKQIFEYARKALIAA